MSKYVIMISPTEGGSPPPDLYSKTNISRLSNVT